MCNYCIIMYPWTAGLCILAANQLSFRTGSMFCRPKNWQFHPVWEICIVLIIVRCINILEEYIVTLGWAIPHTGEHSLCEDEVEMHVAHKPLVPGSFVTSVSTFISFWCTQIAQVVTGGGRGSTCSANKPSLLFSLLHIVADGLKRFNL